MVYDGYTTTSNYLFHVWTVFTSDFVFLVNQSKLGTICEESNNMMQFTSPEIWKQYTVLFGNHTGRPSTKSSEFLGISLRIESYMYENQTSNPHNAVCGGH